MARICYHTNESYFSRDHQGYSVAEITEDVAGYIPLPDHYRSLGDAVECAKALNDARGLTEDDVSDIVASSMRQGAVQ